MAWRHKARSQLCWRSWSASPTSTCDNKSQANKRMVGNCYYLQYFLRVVSSVHLSSHISRWQFGLRNCFPFLFKMHLQLAIISLTAGLRIKSFIDRSTSELRVAALPLFLNRFITSIAKQPPMFYCRGCLPIGCVMQNKANGLLILGF